MVEHPPNGILKRTKDGLSYFGPWLGGSRPGRVPRDPLAWGLGREWKGWPRIPGWPISGTCFRSMTQGRRYWPNSTRS